MKVRGVALALLASTIALGWPARAAAQAIPWEEPKLFEQLGLNEEQIKRVQDIISREDKAIREAKAELDVLKAQLARLLLDPNPDMQQVERLLRSSTEWKLKTEMAEIRRRVEIRKVLGEDKWGQFLRAVRAWRTQAERRAARLDGGAKSRAAAPKASSR